MLTPQPERMRASTATNTTTVNRHAFKSTLVQTKRTAYSIYLNPGQQLVRKEQFIYKIHAHALNKH